jgi:hypothetical protein
MNTGDIVRAEYAVPHRQHTPVECCVKADKATERTHPHSTGSVNVQTTYEIIRQGGTAGGIIHPGCVIVHIRPTEEGAYPFSFLTISRQTSDAVIGQTGIRDSEGCYDAVHHFCQSEIGAYPRSTIIFKSDTADRVVG